MAAGFLSFNEVKEEDKYARDEEEEEYGEEKDR
jgi:hypothetical protein